MNREEALDIQQRKRDERLANLERKRTDHDWEPDEFYEDVEDDDE